jgi:hypothetical protein
VYATTVGRVIAVAEGAKNQLWAATAKKGEVRSGEWYEPVGKVGRKTSCTTNEKLAGELWEWTERELEEWMRK